MKLFKWLVLSVALVVLGVPALGGLWLLLVVCGLIHTTQSEEEIVGRFRAHENDYENIRRMLGNESRSGAVVLSVSDDGVEFETGSISRWFRPDKDTPNRFEKDFPVDRYQEYRSILEQIHGVSVFLVDQNGGVCVLPRAAGWWWFKYSSSIAVCWSEHEPLPIVGNSDDFDARSKNGRDGPMFAFKHLDGKWYLRKGR